MIDKVPAGMPDLCCSELARPAPTADLKGSSWSTEKLHRVAQSDLEAKVAEAYERCHPEDTFGDLKARASFSKEDRGLLTDWMVAFGTEGD